MQNDSKQKELLTNHKVELHTCNLSREITSDENQCEGTYRVSQHKEIKNL